MSKSVPANYGKSDCKCLMCRANRHVINHGARKPEFRADCEGHVEGTLLKNELNRVSLPGDCDYACE